MSSHKNPTQKWIALMIVIVLLGGLIAYLMSKRSVPTDVATNKEATTQEVSNAPETTTSSDVVPVSTKGDQTQQTASLTTVASEIIVSAETSTTQNKSTYKNGTYNTTGNYVSPGGAESILVTLVLKDDVVSDVTVVSNAHNPASKNWQTRFISGVKGEVIGKKIDALNLSVVSGSSLTPVGFMDALAKVKVQAKA